MSYRLMHPEGTCTFRKIMRGRKWVGRVCSHQDGGFVAVIGKHTWARGSTPVAAFEEAAAKHMGFASSAALRERNAEVRYLNRTRRQRGQELARRFLNGSTQDQLNVIDQLFNRLEK